MTSLQAPERPAEAPTENPAIPVRVEEEKPVEGDSPKEESFSREYVETLRAENKEARLKAQRADFLATHVRTLATREACRGIINDPESLGWRGEFEGEDGLPDHDKLRAAAEELATAKPWLARPRGDVGQGQHSDAPAGLSLSELLRS